MTQQVGDTTPTKQYDDSDEVVHFVCTTSSAKELAWLIEYVHVGGGTFEIVPVTSYRYDDGVFKTHSVPFLSYTVVVRASLHVLQAMRGACDSRQYRHHSVEVHAPSIPLP